MFYLYDKIYLIKYLLCTHQCDLWSLRYCLRILGLSLYLGLGGRAGISGGGGLVAVCNLCIRTGRLVWGTLLRTGLSLMTLILL